MTLDLIVPHYREKEDVVKPLLDSIAQQRRFDLSQLGIYIVNDGGHRLSDDFLNAYASLNIMQVDINKSGVSTARNVGLKLSTADYVMFCDCDDCFYHVLALATIQDAVKTHPDILDSTFVEEVPFEDGVISYLREHSPVFIHGKFIGDIF